MLPKILITVFGLVAAANPYVLENSPRDDKLSNDNYSVCNTKECESMANLIINGMNKTADPCTDFYNYACGSWPKNYPVSKEISRQNIRIMFEKKIQGSFRKILQEEPKPNDSVPLTIEKKWIKTCMNLEKGLEPLVKIIEQIGGWPIAMQANKWDEKKFPWQKVAAYYASLIGHQLSSFSVYFLTDLDNPDSQVLALDRPISPFDPEFWLGTSEDVQHVKELTEFHFHQLLLQLPSAYANYTENNIDSTLVLKNTASYLKFHFAVEEYSDNEEEEVDLEENKMTISDLQKYYDRRTHYNDTSKIDWLEMIRAATNNNNEIEVDGSDQILVIGKKYLDRLFTLLEVTSHETIVNYIHSMFIIKMLRYLNKETRELLLTNIRPRKLERLDECIEDLKLKDGVTYEYLKQYFPESIKEAVTEMAAEIHNEIDNDISHTSWMDNETKLLTREKLEAMTIKIGYPDYFKDEKKFSSVYSDFEVGSDYFDNVMNYIKQINLNILDPLGKHKWSMKPLTANAKYFRKKNSFTIPAGMILNPLYSSTGPVATNYGSVGCIIGHEISHGFDVKGRQYDKNGNATSWWSNEAVAAYEERANCFIKQYDSYKVNGTLTQAENMADAMGLNAAFAAYTKKMKNETREIRLPGLEKLDGNQLFFISFANMFCQSATPIVQSLLEKDVHTRSWMRVNGTVSNVNGFAAAFQCSKKSPLNSVKKCVLWD